VADSPLIERVPDAAVGPATSVAGDGSAGDATLQRSADASAAAPARPTIGRRPGLGAPMTELPPTAVLRSAAVDDGLLASWHLPASPLPPGESAVLGGSAGIGAAGPAPAGSAASGAGAGSLRAALVHRRADDAAVVPSLPVVGDSLAGDEPSAELTTAGPDPTLQRSGDTTAPTGSSDRALAGDRALTEAVSVGSSSGVLVGPSDVTAAAAVPAARSVLGVPAGARTSGAGALGSGSPGGLGGTSSGGGPTGQSGPGLVARQVATATGGVEVRGAAAPASSISASGAPSGSAAQSASSAGGFRGAPAVMLQRTVSAVASSSASGSPGRPLPSLAMVQRAPSPTSVAVAGPSASYDPLDGGTGGQGFAVQREADEPQAADAGSSGSGADPHGAEAANAAAGGASAAGGGGGGGGTPAEGAAATGSSAQAEAELEALAGRLYDRIRHRLRRELLDDRERSGLVLDRVR
jgi:hypothetical protein